MRNDLIDLASKALPRFKKEASGVYRDQVYGLRIIFRGRNDWVISAECCIRGSWIFVYGRETMASLIITGFTTLREAKAFDVLRFVANSMEKAVTRDMLFVSTRYFGTVPFTLSVDHRRLAEEPFFNR